MFLPWCCTDQTHVNTLGSELRPLLQASFSSMAHTRRPGCVKLRADGSHWLGRYSRKPGHTPGSRRGRRSECWASRVIRRGAPNVLAETSHSPLTARAMSKQPTVFPKSSPWFRCETREEAKQPDGIMREISLPAATTTQRANQDGCRSECSQERRRCARFGRPWLSMSYRM